MNKPAHWQFNIGTIYFFAWLFSWPMAKWLLERDIKQSGLICAGFALGGIANFAVSTFPILVNNPSRLGMGAGLVSVLRASTRANAGVVYVLFDGPAYDEDGFARIPCDSHYQLSNEGGVTFVALDRCIERYDLPR